MCRYPLLLSTWVGKHAGNDGDKCADCLAVSKCQHKKTENFRQPKKKIIQVYYLPHVHYVSETKLLN